LLFSDYLIQTGVLNDDFLLAFALSQFDELSVTKLYYHPDPSTSADGWRISKT